MGVMSFQLPNAAPETALRDLDRACVAGGYDNMPAPTRVQRDNGRLKLLRDMDESGYLVVPWEVNSGAHFPDSDPRWAGASSLDLLERAVALVAEQGLEVGNVDVTVVLESPKLRDHVDAMRANLARVLRLEPGRVSVKAKTNEGVDAVGRGEAIAVHAVALLRSRI